MESFKETKITIYIALVTICLLGLALRLLGLESEDYWYDELFSYYTANQSFGAMWHTIVNDVHPPLFYLLFHYWLKIFGQVVSLRLFVAVWGVLTIPLVYLVGKKAIRSEVGLLAAFLLAISPFHVKYSQDLRMYTMYPFFLTLAMLALICALRYKKWRFWVFLAVANALMFYTHYHTVFQIFAQAVFVAAYLLKKAEGRITRRAIGSYALMAVLIAPWVRVILHQWQVKQVAYAWVPKPALSDLFHTFFIAYLYGLEVLYIHKVFMWGFGIGLLGFLVINAVRRRSRERRDFLFLIFVSAVVIPIGVTYLLSFTQFRFFFLWRYIILSLIPFLLLLACLLAKVRPQLLRFMLIAAVAVSGILCSLKADMLIVKPRWKTLVEGFERVATREDRVYAYPHELLGICYDYYAKKGIALENFRDWLDTENEVPERFYLILDPKQEREGVNPFLLPVLRRYATVETLYDDRWHILLLRVSDIDTEAIREWYGSREWMGREELIGRDLVEIYDASWGVLDSNAEFSFKEVSGDFSYMRWTSSEEVTLQMAGPFEEGFYWILLRLMQGYSEKIKDWEYTVCLNEETRTITQENYSGYTGFYLFGSPRLDVLRVSIHSPLFNPVEMELSDDNRILGLQFHWLAILRVNPEMVPEDQHFKILDIGSLDEAAEQLIGWHTKERAEDFDFRWTSERAQIEFLLPPAVGEKLNELKVKALRGGPDDIAPPFASVYLNGQILGKRRIANTSQVYAFPLAQGDCQTSNILTIESSTWNPKERGLSSDDRNLGIIVDWIMLD